MLSEEQVKDLGKQSRKTYQRFIATLEDMTDEKKDDQKLASEVANFMVRQLNDDSLKGDIDWENYRTMVLRSTKGLWKLIYLKYYTDNFEEERDPLFYSSLNFLMMMFTRVYHGRDREIILKKIEAQQDVYNVSTGGNG